MSNRPGKLNNHLEAAIHEAMSELDKMSGTVSIYDFHDLRERCRNQFLLVKYCFFSTYLFLYVCVLPDPIKGSSGEAPQAQEEENIQITLNVWA